MQMAMWWDLCRGRKMAMFVSLCVYWEVARGKIKEGRRHRNRRSKSDGKKKTIKREKGKNGGCSKQNKDAANADRMV